MWTATHVEEDAVPRVSNSASRFRRAQGPSSFKRVRTAAAVHQSRGGCQFLGGGIFVEQAAPRNQPSSPQSEGRNCHPEKSKRRVAAYFGCVAA